MEKVLYCLNIKWYMYVGWFLRRGENRSTQRKTSGSRVENQQTQPTYDAASGNCMNPGHIGGKCCSAFVTELKANP